MSSKLAAAMNQSAPNAAGREQTPYEKFRNQIEKLRPEIAALVGKDSVDRFIRVCLNAVQSNPKVLTADRKSLLIACMRSAQDHLLPDGREAVLNIYPTKVKVDNVERWVDMVQYLPMVGGLIKKLYDSGHVTFVDAVAVYEMDKFEYRRGDDPRIEHIPYDGEQDPGKLKAAYVVMKLKNGETKREVMFRRDVEKVKSKSKAAKGLMWTDFEDQAWIKSVIKRAYKQVPSSMEIDRAIAADNAAIGLEGVETAASTEPSTELSALVDGRLDQELRRPPVQKTESKEPVAAAGEIVAGDAGKVEDETANAGSSSSEPSSTANATSTGSAKFEKTPGTKEAKEAIIGKMKTCSDLDTLGLLADDANVFEWTEADRKEITDAYLKRLEEIEG